MKKLKFIILALALAFCFSLAVFASDGRDTTFENSLAKDLKALGLFSGVSDTDFDLDRAPTRTEVLVMLIRVLGEEKVALEGEFSHPFDDVPEWANAYVGYAYENGLTKGVSATKFGNDTASSATYLTFMLRALGYSDAKGDFKWDAPHTLARGLGLLPACVDTENFLRADIVTVSYAALSMELKGTTETLSEKLIAKGAFSAESFASAYTATKITDKENEGKSALSAEDVYANCSPAVFYIEIQNKEGTPLSSGSGFFIDESGIAVTNCHVMYGAEKAVITVSGSGAKYDVRGVYYFSADHDIAVIQVDGSGFKTLGVNPFAAKGAASVYAIGSPKGLQNTISQGIISNPRRVVSGGTYIQTTAAISGGSSGGVLLNSFGEVIGITSATLTEGQNLNFARPISYLALADLGKETPIANMNWNYAEYSTHEESYTIAAGGKLKIEFDVVYSTVDSKMPKFKATSDNTDVCVAKALFNDTFVALAAVAPGTANITISDDTTNDSVTFTVTVTEGTVKEKPYVEFYSSVEKIGLNKGAKTKLLISSAEVGIDENAKLTVASKDPRTAKITDIELLDGYVQVEVSAIKNGTTSLAVTCQETDDIMEIPVTVGEQFYAAFDMLKAHATENGKLHEFEDASKNYYHVEGRQYTGGDVVNLIYYPKSDKLCLRATSVLLPDYMEVVLTRESESTGKRVDFVMNYSTYSIHAAANIKSPGTFGDGKDDSLKFDEYTGDAGIKQIYEIMAPKLFIAVLYEFDMWFRYEIPEVEATDFGFVKLDYDAYGLSSLM